MGLEKLNSAALKYFESRSDFNFETLYKEASEEFREENRAIIIRSGLGDHNDADEIFDKVILRLVNREGVRLFGNVMSTSLRNARYNFMRDERTRRSRYRLILDDSDTAISDEISEVGAEEEFFFRQRKKESDQRQLIDFLVNDPSKVDHDTTLIVSQFPQHSSITALAKALGLHHEYVKRKLRRLSRGYDANRFGDYSEYLAV